MTTACDQCEEKATKRCGRCQRVAYCSSTCQRKAWKTHRQTCVSSKFVPMYKDMKHIFECEGGAESLVSGSCLTGPLSRYSDFAFLLPAHDLVTCTEGSSSGTERLFSEAFFVSTTLRSWEKHTEDMCGVDKGVLKEAMTSILEKMRKRVKQLDVLYKRARLKLPGAEELYDEFTFDILLLICYAWCLGGDIVGLMNSQRLLNQHTMVMKSNVAAFYAFHLPRRTDI